MTLTTTERDRLRRALSTYVDETPPAPEWQDWDIHSVEPVRRRRTSRGPAIALATAIVVLIGIGGMLLFPRTGSPDTPVAAQDDPVTWGDWYDAIVAAGEPVGGDPLILQGAIGPKPEFDTTELGEEQHLEPMTPANATELPWSDLARFKLSDDSEHSVVVAAGGVASVVAGLTDGAPEGEPFVGEPVLCEIVVAPIWAPMYPKWSAEAGCSPLYGKDGRAGALDNTGPWLLEVGDGWTDTDGEVGHPGHALFAVPLETSVITLEAGGAKLWQRPRSGLALFVGGLSDNEIRVAAYAASGALLMETSYPPVG